MYPILITLNPQHARGVVLQAANAEGSIWRTLQHEEAIGQS